MAYIYPNLETIKKLKVPPTDGEWRLLNFLLKNINDEYEIFFQPFINGDRPDIILMRKKSGVMIIEVKDWDLKHYWIDEKGTWKVRQNNATIKSPLDQVETYKKNLFNLHIEHLLEKQIIHDNKLYGRIALAVYFHNESASSINSFLDNTLKENQKNYIDLLGQDTLNPESFYQILGKRGLSKENDLFDDDLYFSFKRHLQPTYHTLEQGINIAYTQRQLDLAESKNVQQKIKGVAGSGKTVILAKRAVNAHKRTGDAILVMTFNITLKNYIHDNISNVRENFDWSNFFITNYHQLIQSTLNNFNMPDWDLNIYSNENIFKNVESQIIKYKAIFIDEIQDYETAWIKIIKKYFLAEGGEFVVFGDEKQNIYERILDQEKRPNTTIPGRWGELNDSFRFSKKIANFAEKFQKHFFADKYEIDILQIIHQPSLFRELEPNIEYYYLNKKTPLLQIIKMVNSIIRRENIHPNDICFLSSKLEILRELDYLIRKESSEKTKTTFETKEVFEKLKTKNTLWELNNVRKYKKIHFWMNDGTMKLSTTHSFKGWEIPNLFLIINDADKNDELIYTAITRCRNNLFIISIENNKYHSFFSINVDKCPKISKGTMQDNEDLQQKSITFENVENTEREILIPILLEELQGHNKNFKICILGETSASKEDIEKKLASYFQKNGVRANKWDIDIIRNNKIKNSDILKSLRKGRSSYSLIITGQIHQHSTKGNSEANLLKELMKEKYIDHVRGCMPQKKLINENIIEKIDEYLEGKRGELFFDKSY